MRSHDSLLMIIFLWLLSPCLWAVDVQVQGLLKGAVILQIDGKQRMLKVGQRSPEGVLLIEADPKQAVVEIDGERQRLTLSRRISSKYNPVSTPKVTIRRNAINQFITTAKINGKRLQVLVDTGANAVAMSSRDATKLQIDYKQGVPSMVRTASGDAPSYRVVLRSVDVGGIQVSRVMAFVIEGDYPQTVLLGMSFLQHVELSEQHGILTLHGKY
ncbi:MAG: retropepsin-like aspartic protease [Pseudomonadales bacterium]